jgi:hypothetical protein
MFLKDFDLNKYNKNLYLLSDLCISNKNIIISNALKDVDISYCGINSVFVLYYNMDLLDIKHLINMKINFEKEKNIRNISIIGNVLRIVFTIPQKYMLDYRLRIKYGIKYINKTALQKMMLFWGEYNYSFS